MRGMRLKMKAKLVVLLVIPVLLLDMADTMRLSQVDSECDFDFKEQPEDFYGMLDAVQVSNFMRHSQYF